MTEAEWLASTDPKWVLAGCVPAMSDRKKRLLSAACCRHVEPSVECITSRRAEYLLAAIERHADDPLSEAELSRLAGEVYDAYDRVTSSAAVNGWAELAIHAALWPSADYAACLEWAARSDLWNEQEGRAQSDLIRCVFGNPFRPVVFGPSWRTSTVLALAAQMYESRDFSAMPILADALGDAGCKDEAILTHCRGPGPHCRGCHVVDACLGKS